MIDFFSMGRKNMKWVYRLLYATTVISLLLAVIFFFAARSYLKEARLYDATIVAIVKASDFPSEQQEVMVAKFSVNGVEMEKRSKVARGFEPSEKKELIGLKTAIFYRDGDAYFTENTFFSKWCGAFISCVFGIASLVSILTCRIIEKMANALEQKMKSGFRPESSGQNG